MRIKNWKIFNEYIITDRRVLYDKNVYYFKSPKNNYEIKITPYQGKDDYYSVGFGISDILNYNTNIIVNENPYEIMETVFGVMKEFVKEENYIKGFIFSFTGDKEKNNQRLKLYKRSINKYFPESKLELNQGIYYLIL